MPATSRRSRTPSRAGRWVDVRRAAVLCGPGLSVAIDPAVLGDVAARADALLPELLDLVGDPEARGYIVRRRADGLVLEVEGEARP